MKILTLLFLSVLPFSCISGKFVEGRGSQVNRTIQYEGVLQALKAGGTYDVVLDSSVPEGMLHISAFPNIFRYMEVSWDDGVLVLKMRSGYRYRNIGRLRVALNPAQIQSFTISGAAELKSSVPVEQERISIRGSGASDIKFFRIRTESMRLEVSGSCDLHVQQLQAADMKVRCSGAGDVKMDGNAADLEIGLSGTSEFDGRNFWAEKVLFQGSGASDALLNVRKKLTGKLSGTATLSYGGRPDHVEVSTSGAASLSKR